MKSALALFAASVCLAANPLDGLFEAANLKTEGPVAVSSGPSGKVTLRFSPGEKRGAATFAVPAAARNWSGAAAFTFTFRCDSTQWWDLRLRNAKGETFGWRVLPWENVEATAAISHDLLTREFINNRGYAGFALSNWANHIDITSVETITASMSPARPVTCVLGPMQLSTTPVEPSARIDRPVVDEFGQWAADPKRVDHDGLKRLWAAEDAALKRTSTASRYGGFTDAPKRRATGYFRAERVDGRWWLVDPDGNLFFSTGMDCVQVGENTPVKGREHLFAKLPQGSGATANFYAANVAMRFSTENTFPPFKARAYDRLRSWGFNTVANWSDERFGESPAMPWVTGVHIDRWAKSWQGYPDVFDQAFVKSAEAAARQQCERYAKDPYLLGWFIGNEPHWQNRGLVDRILADAADTATKRYITAFLRDNSDSAASRDALLEKLARRYFEVITAAIRKADPNHMVLGIRWAGNAPDPVLRANDVFDVFSINIYRFAPPPEQIEKIAALTKRPIIIGEFHFGTAERGLGPALVPVLDQSERGVAYTYYVEQSAASPHIVGTHYFQYIDQLPTGRFDGENYNLGFVNGQDVPYAEMVKAARETHARIYRIHAGALAPSARMPRVRQ